MVVKANTVTAIATMYWPPTARTGLACPSPSVMARVVSREPSTSPSCQTPVVMMTRQVIVTTTIVSMKVCVIETMAWRTGSRVLAAAAAIAPLPIPASLEKIPRAKPCWMASMRPAPANPPAGAV